MSDYTKIITANIKNIREALIDMSLDSFVTCVIEATMCIERKEYLDVNREDKGNGYYSRAFNSIKNNSLLVNVPRTRSGGFTPTAIELIKLHKEQRDNFSLELLKKGMTTKDIRNLMSEFFGESLSKTKITNLASKFNDIRKAWENSSLESYYKVVFCDVMFVTVRRGNSYEKEGVYICYGVRDDNKRELLALEVNPTESASVWEDVLEGIKKRGVELVDLIVSDGLKGMKGATQKVFPQSRLQRCVVHKMRNLLKKVRSADKTEFAEDLKWVFDNFDKTSTKAKAKERIERFKTKWAKKYPSVRKKLKQEDILDYLTYIDYDKRVRRMIYTTNSVENLNRIVRKATKNKLSFESPERLLDYVFMALKEFEEDNLMKYPVREYKYFKLTEKEGRK